MSKVDRIKCSVIIRCYNEEQHIGRLLSGIMQQTVKNAEIIIVDSGSSDATLSIASRYPVKICSIEPEGFSFGRSINTGCQKARGEFIVIASAHIYPLYQDWLEQLLTPFSDPQVALAYGKQRGNKNTQYAEQRIFAQWFPEQSNLQQRHPFCNNANAAIRRALWEQQPYNEELTGLEDLDWANRVIALRYYLAYVAEAEVIHVHNETLLQTYNRYRREAIAFKHIFPFEHFNFWNFIRLWIANVFSDYKHALQGKGQKRGLLTIPCFRLMQFWGTYRGYSQHKPISQQLRHTFYYPNSPAPTPNPSGQQRTDLQIHYDEFTGQHL